MEIFKNKKLTISYTLIILMCILMGNTNNNPTPYIQRIFKPINFKNGTFYYSTIIMICAICFCLKFINKEKENKFINTVMSRFIVALFIMGISAGLGTYCTKFYKSFSSDLNAIYLNRKETSLEINLEGDKLRVKGDMLFLNCGNKEKIFSVKVKLPNDIRQQIDEDYIVLSNQVKIHPRQKSNIYINEEFDYNVKYKNESYTCQAFEYTIFDENDEIVFKGQMDDYFEDNK